MVFYSYYILKQIPVQIPFDISNNEFSIFLRVNFFCFFGKISLYDFASAGKVLNLVFRTYKIAYKNQIRFVSQILSNFAKNVNKP